MLSKIVFIVEDFWLVVDVIVLFELVVEVFEVLDVFVDSLLIVILVWVEEVVIFSAVAEDETKIALVVKIVVIVSAAVVGTQGLIFSGL